MKEGNFVKGLREISTSATKALELEEKANSEAKPFLDACDELHKSWSQSHLGRSGMLYIEGFAKRNATDFFDQSWGFLPMSLNRTKGKWHLYSEDEVRDEIFKRAGTRDIVPLELTCKQPKLDADSLRSKLIGKLDQAVVDFGGDHLAGLLGETRELTVKPNSTELIFKRMPQSYVSRDADLLAEPRIAPPHFTMQAYIECELRPFKALHRIKEIADEASIYLSQRKPTSKPESSAWRILNPFYWILQLVGSPILVPISVWKEPGRLLPKVVAAIAAGILCTWAVWKYLPTYVSELKPPAQVPIAIAVGLAAFKGVFDILREVRAEKK